MKWFKRKKQGGDKSPEAPLKSVTQGFEPEPARQGENSQEACEPVEATGAPGRQKQGFFRRLTNHLSKTRQGFVSRVDQLLLGKREIDEALLEELEEILITSDLGVQTTMALIEKVREKVERKDLSNPKELKEALQSEILHLLKVPPGPGPMAAEKPHVIMVVGVNGVGKTTTIGKLGARYVKQGKRVLFIAADTFRAAAVEQLAVWAERITAELVRHKDKSDPSAVVYDGIHAAKARGADVVIIDTAGRLHTRVNLMEELKKIRRTVTRQVPDAPHEILLVLDATTGQNAISQAQLFHEALEITGIALTKLDGTAKGGIVVGICDSLE
ncbi:MAG: signal recognition particle-docking protein FtsY, partial [Chloroflexota bacterium]|nr:signal recognition particle-docking protein FtsY [Chloroflexota bacterium]